MYAPDIDRLRLFARPTADPATVRVLLPSSLDAEVGIERSSRARRVRLVADPGLGVRLVVPVGASLRGAERFAQSQASWIERQLARRSHARGAAVGFTETGLAWLDGDPLPITFAVAPRARVSRAADRLDVRAPSVESGSSAVVRFYRREAMIRVESLVAHHADRVGVRPQSVAIGSGRRRLGSCSSSGRILVSWRTVLARPEIQAYIVVHELCHLREFHHRREFWDLVRTHDPDADAAARWLRAHAWELAKHEPRPG